MFRQLKKAETGRRAQGSAPGTGQEAGPGVGAAAARGGRAAAWTQGVTGMAGPILQRAPEEEMPDPGLAGEPAPADAKVLEQQAKVLEQHATTLETEILNHAVYKGLQDDSKVRVQGIIARARTKPLGDAKGERNYYLAKLKLAITTPFAGATSGKAEYGCSPDMEKKNRDAVKEALRIEDLWGGAYSDVDETAVASGTNKVERTGQGGKKFKVDRSDSRNIRVQIKVKLNGAPDDVAMIRKLEDAIERAVSIDTKGYYLDIVFVNAAGPDVFEFRVNFCEWPNSGNWASPPMTLSHEVHHALGLPDRYDYIESHAGNANMNVEMRLVWFEKQMQKTQSVRDPFSKMARNTRTLLAEDVCAVAFAPGTDRNKCVEARKSLDPAGVPPL